MTDVSMTIGGERRAAPSTFGVVNPATGEVHAEAPDCSREQLDEAFDAASKAFVDWRTDEDARRAALTRGGQASARRPRTRIGPGADRRAGQAARRRARWRRYAAGVLADVLRRPRAAARGHPGRRQRLRRGRAPPDGRRRRDHAVELPAGPRRAGRSPRRCSPATRWCSSRRRSRPAARCSMGEILNEVLPPGVLNVVSGGDELGQWMTSHPDAAQDQLHRLGGDRQAGRRVGRPRPQAGHPRARRQRPRHRARRRRPGDGRREALPGRVRQQRPGLLGDQAGVRARGAARRRGRRARRPGRGRQGRRRHGSRAPSSARSTTGRSTTG